jgi:tetratricopeptide (TPR) repeat protein
MCGIRTLEIRPLPSGYAKSAYLPGGKIISLAKLMQPITWPSLVTVLVAFLVALWGIAKLFFQTAIKEGVKSEFDRRLESHKVALDLQKQQVLKDFGLFADKRHEVNTAVYSALRSAYRSVNRTHGLHQEVGTELFTAVELDEFLNSLGASLDLRKSLVQLNQVSPEVGTREVNRAMVSLRIDEAEREVIAARELTYSNELFLARPVIEACDEAIALLGTALGRNESKTALGGVPRVLARVKARMRTDLLGEPEEEDKSLLIREEDPNPPRFFTYPKSIPMAEFSKFEESIGRLVARGFTTLQSAHGADLAARGSALEMLKTSERSSSAEPMSFKARFEHAKALLELGHIQKAVEEAEQLLRQEPENLDAVLLLAESLILRSRIPSPDAERSIQLIDQYIARRPNDPKGLYVRGLALLLTGFPADAAENLRQALALDPSYVRARATLAEVYRRLGEINKAIEEADLTLSAAPRILSAQLTRIELLANLNRWDFVLRVSEQVFKLDPTNPRATRLTGTALNKLGNPAEAAKFADRFRPDSAARTAALAVRARARFNLKEYDAALRDAEEALSRDATDPDAHLARAQSLAALERWDDAVKAATEAYRFLSAHSYESEINFAIDRELLLDVLRSVHKAKYKPQQPTPNAVTS